jgi:hypothetical protein
VVMRRSNLGAEVKEANVAQRSTEGGAMDGDEEWENMC